MSNLIIKEQLLNYFTYNQNEGEFYLKNRLVGSLDRQGYVTLKYNGETYRLNKLIYFIHNNHLITKDEFIIHINGNRSDSRIENLKVVDRDNNIETDNRGVYYYKRLNKYGAFVDRGRVRTLIDYFDTEEEAIEKRDEYNSNIENNNAIELPTQQYLQECFDYNEETGLAYWKERPLHHFGSVGKQSNFNNRYSGNLINSKDDKKYIIVGIDRKYYKLHRLIWKMYYGEDPKYFIDHINGIADDNRICNLRDIDNTYNQRNHSKLSTKNTTGYIGVSPVKDTDRWRATIKKDNKTLHVGDFQTIEEAALARELKAVEMYGEDFYYRNEAKKILLEELKLKVKIIENDRDFSGYSYIFSVDGKYCGRIITKGGFVETEYYDTIEETYIAIMDKNKELGIIKIRYQ